MLNQKWQAEHLRNIKFRAGFRYSPVLNVSLPIASIFNGLTRSEQFYESFLRKYGELLRSFKYISSDYNNLILQRKCSEIETRIKEYFSKIASIKQYNTIQIDWTEIKKKSDELNKLLFSFMSDLYQENKNLKEINTPLKKGVAHKIPLSEKIDFEIHHIQKTQDAIRYFKNFSQSEEAQLSNHPFLLLTGEAGTGKTHLLCDIASGRLVSNDPTFLVFGEYFSNDEGFWEQFFVQLEIQNKIKSKEDFLKKLDRSAALKKSRSLIIVDALNENIAHAPGFWKNNLDEIIADIKKYPNIAFVISVRSGFEDDVLSEKHKACFIEKSHTGFRFKEWEAVTKFFNEFSIPLPEVPLLMSEFQNPLFLLLFCSAFSPKKKDLSVKKRNDFKKWKKKKKIFFRGHEGATYIFESFIRNATKEIAEKFKIDKGNFSDPGYRVWYEVIKEVAREMVSGNVDRISEKKLLGILNAKYPNINAGKFLHTLESNMLITRIPRNNYNEINNGVDIRFPFQKFSDHLIGRYIFQAYEADCGRYDKNLKTAKKFFSKRRKLGRFLLNSYNRGIIEALSIQCPEHLKGVEFIEVVPYLKKDLYLSQLAQESFLASLIWRRPNAFSKNLKNTLNIINRQVLPSLGETQLLDTFLSVASVPNHPFNAERLHSHLIKFPLADRDSWWSTFLHYQYGEQGAVDRILDWAWSDDYSTVSVSDESVFLISIALAWFLTTPNRFVRDKATKGLVSLLQNRIKLLPQLLGEFKNVNDPYILERLYAVAYGCVLRNKSDVDNLKLLAIWVYENTFKSGKPPLNILLRDYARGVIEIAFKNGISLKFKESDVKPPYNSVWPKRIHTREYLKKKFYPEDFISGKSRSRGFLDIWSSVMDRGDFALYEIGINTWSCQWSGRRLNSSGVSRKKIYKAFKEKLSLEQKELLERGTNTFFGIDLSSSRIIIEDIDTKGDEIERLEFKKNKKVQMRTFLRMFEQSLSEEMLLCFRKEVKPFLLDNGNIKDPLETFDLRIAQRWIFDRVVKLGYNPQLHEEFDTFVNSHRLDRKNHKPERIGKKYQWIAFYEFMGLLSDSFQFKKDSWSDKKGVYVGSWDPYMRDIDPSYILQNDNHIKNCLSLSEWMSKDGNYDAWAKNKSPLSWIKSSSDLPNPKKNIEIKDDRGTKWLVLDGYVKWEEHISPEIEKYAIPQRELDYSISSYILKKSDFNTFFSWAKKQNFTEISMPVAQSFYEVFLGEYPNSVAFEDFRGDFNIWTQSSTHSESLPVPLVVTSDYYLNEFVLDCSHTGKTTIKLPSKWLVNKMGLCHKFLDGKFYDGDGNLIALATSIFDDSFPSYLLINKDFLFSFLEDNGYSIVWVLEGEKSILGGEKISSNNEGRLVINGVYSLSNKSNIVGKAECEFVKY